MQIAAQIVIGLVAFIHVYILWLEMFAWTTKAPQVFKTIPKDLFVPTKTLAANQGLYNGFLAAGLFWSLCAPTIYALSLANFFLGCVLVAGIYGGLTASKKIIYIQAVPAALALLMVNLNY